MVTYIENKMKLELLNLVSSGMTLLSMQLGPGQLGQ